MGITKWQTKKVSISSEKVVNNNNNNNETETRGLQSRIAIQKKVLRYKGE